MWGRAQLAGQPRAWQEGGEKVTQGVACVQWIYTELEHCWCSLNYSHPKAKTQRCSSYQEQNDLHPAMPRRTVQRLSLIKSDIYLHAI